MSEDPADDGAGGGDAAPDDDGAGRGDATPTDGGPGGDGTDPADGGDGFAASHERARELLEREDVDGLYAAVVDGDEYDYVFAHRGEGDAETVGMQAMGLLAQHVGALVEETGQPPAQVAGDAAMLARTLGVTGEESLADIEADIEAARGEAPDDRDDADG